MSIISQFLKKYICVYIFSVKGDVGVGSGWRDTKVYIREIISSFQLNNKFYWKHTILQRNMLIPLSAEVRSSLHEKPWVLAWWSPHVGASMSGLLTPAKRSEFPFSLPHLLPALSCLFWMVSTCGSRMTGVQWKQTAVLRASSSCLSDVNDVTGRPRQECECERHHTCCFLLTPAQGFPRHRGKPRSWGKWSRIPAPYSGEPPLQEECTSTPVPDSRGWRHRHDLPGFMSSHTGGITWAISWYQHFLQPPLSGSSRPSWGIPSLPRPSWGSPQSPQAFLGESPASPGLPGGTPQLPWVLPESPRIWRPQTVWSLGHIQCPANSLLTTQCVCWNPRPWAL